MDDIEAPVEGVLAAFRGMDDCTVRLGDGEEVAAVMDTEALRAAHGRVYGIGVGRSVRAVRPATAGPMRIVWLEQV